MPFTSQIVGSIHEKIQEIVTMDDSSYRRNFDLDKKNEIHYHSWKEHFNISKIAKFGCELLYNDIRCVGVMYNVENIVL